jgi:hypothetical protein
MILVAAFGAAIAYWIAHAEQSSAKLHRQLTLGQMMELSFRQETIADLGYRAVLEERQRGHRVQAKLYQQAADRIRRDSPELADQARDLDYLSQQEERLWWFIRSMTVPLAEIETGDKLAKNLSDAVGLRLMRQGFYRGPAGAAHGETPAHGAAKPEPPAGQKPDPNADPKAEQKSEEKAESKVDPSFKAIVESARLGIWERLYADIHALHEHVPLLAMVVVFFVVALLCLTFADLTASTPWLSNVALIAGVVFSVGALAAALISDISVWRPVLVVAAICVVAGATFWKIGILHLTTHGETPHPPELEARQTPFAHMVIRHVHDFRERVGVMLVAVTVLLSSVVGYWYASSQTRSNRAADQAFESEVRLNNLIGERWVNGTTTQLTPGLTLLSQRLRCALASQRVVLLPESASPSTRQIAESARVDECGALAVPANVKASGALDAVRFDTASGPGSALITRARYGDTANPAQLYALADGYISVSEIWERQSAIYLLGLTIFAIALYLLGQALGMGDGAPGLVLAASGVVLALGTFTYTAVVHARTDEARVPKADGACQTEGGSAIEVSAVFYGRARALYDAAETGEDYRKAAALFDCALAARPGFARAQYERSLADSFVGQNDVGSSYTNFPTKARMPQIYASVQKTAEVLEEGGWTPTPRMLNSHGFNAELLALTSGEPRLLDEAIALFQQAIVAAGFLGTDGKPIREKVAALSEDDRGMFQIIYTNLGLGRLGRNDWPYAQQAYNIALEHFDLAKNDALIASSLSDLNTLDEYCTGLKLSDDHCRQVRGHIAEVRRMLLVGKAGAFAPAQTTAAITDLETFARPARVGWKATIRNFDPKRDAVTVVWSTLAADWNVWRVVQPLFERVDPAKIKSGQPSESSVYYSAGASSCLPPGKYRAEFFLNGTMVVGGREVEVGPYEDYRSREANLALCKPKDWTESSFRQNDEGRHLVRAFTNSSGASTAYVFAFFAPRGTFNPIEYDSKAWLLLKRWTKTGPTDDQFATAFNKYRGCGEAVPQGTVLHREWTQADGMVYVAFVLGNKPNNDDACQVLESIGNYYGRDQGKLKDVFRVNDPR